MKHSHAVVGLSQHVPELSRLRIQLCILAEDASCMVLMCPFKLKSEMSLPNSQVYTFL